MKKSAILLTVIAFLVSGALFHACKKDDCKDLKTTQSPVLKNAMDLNLMMGQFNDIGDVDIYVNYPGLFVEVEFDAGALDGYEVVEMHLWADEEVPPYPQSQFPNYWNIDMGPFPGIWSFDMTEYGTLVTCDDGTTFYDYTFDWYFALHMQLEKEVYELIGYDPDTGEEIWGYVTYEETAWVLNDGTNWTNKKGKPMGWGEYYIVPFDDGQECTPLP